MISKSNLIKTFGPIGGYAIVRWLMRNEPRIIMFHRFSLEPKENYISSGVLEQQLLYIKKHLSVIPLSQLRQCKEQGRPLPKNSVVLTVDDGYRDFYQVAYPLLEKHRLPATLFVTTGFINRELWLWPDQITWLLNKSDFLPEPLKLGSEFIEAQPITYGSQKVLWGRIIAYLLSIDDHSKHEWISHLANVLKLNLPNQPPSEFEACTWDELREMQANGIEIGGHTHTHPSLGQVSENQLKEEISTCVGLMAQQLGSSVRDFCFPNGQPNDHNETVKHVVKVGGFRSSVTAFYDRLATSDLFEMRRHTASEDWFQFCKSVNGVEAMMAKYVGAHNKMEGTFC